MIRIFFLLFIFYLLYILAHKDYFDQTERDSNQNHSQDKEGTGTKIELNITEMSVENRYHTDGNNAKTIEESTLTTARDKPHYEGDNLIKTELNNSGERQELEEEGYAWDEQELDLDKEMIDIETILAEWSKFVEEKNIERIAIKDIQYREEEESFEEETPITEIQIEAGNEETEFLSPQGIPGSDNTHNWSQPSEVRRSSEVPRVVPEKTQNEEETDLWDEEGTDLWDDELLILQGTLMVDCCESVSPTSEDKRPSEELEFWYEELEFWYEELEFWYEEAQVEEEIKLEKQKKNMLMDYWTINFDSSEEARIWDDQDPYLHEKMMTTLRHLILS